MPTPTAEYDQANLADIIFLDGNDSVVNREDPEWMVAWHRAGVILNSKWFREIVTLSAHNQVRDGANAARADVDAARADANAARAD
uniref:hypothetical protein n=1 Tax=Agromyces humi TaxID=1766800 RepID=UPI0013599147